jgi:hypothetical protein
MECAWRSCWIRSAGGLTSREEYSMVGFSSGLSVVFFVDSGGIDGSCVRSIDYGPSDTFMWFSIETYSENPPPFLELAQYYTALVCLDGVHRFAT